MGRLPLAGLWRNCIREISVVFLLVCLKQHFREFVSPGFVVMLGFCGGFVLVAGCWCEFFFVSLVL